MLNEILNAVLDSLVMVSSFGIFMLFCAFSNSESIQGVSVLAIVAIIITLSYTVYGKQALDKIKSLGNLKDEDIVVIDKAEGWEQRGT